LVRQAWRAVARLGNPRRPTAATRNCAASGDQSAKSGVDIISSGALTHSARAVDLAYNAGGGSTVYSSSSLGRCFRDVHTATQHIMVSPRMLETFGKLRLGIDVDTAML
jgi:hypothetical protein